jgi:guanosine-3',5'-bis(diphosphate) 3'-pyrophosphohydrolase
MRTLHHIKSPEKRRRRIARRRPWTSTRRSPSASACSSVKDELEDMAFAELNPDARDNSIGAPGLSARARRREPGAKQIEAELDQDAEGGRARMPRSRAGRKSPYSIWRKMQRKNVSFEQLSDIMAFRIMVKDVAECYQALGVLHGRYPVLPGASRTTSRRPSPERLPSLHTAVIGPLRSASRSRSAPTRDARPSPSGAWPRTGSTSRAPSKIDGAAISLAARAARHPGAGAQCRGIPRAHQARDVPGPGVLLHAQGRADRLPRGATPVDFAYAVHSEVGDTCVGAKINGRIVPLTHRFAERRPGRHHHFEGADAVADLGTLRRHRQSA